MSLNCTCSKVLLTFYSNDTDYGSESFFQTATFVTVVKPPPEPPTLAAIIGLWSVFIFMIVCAVGYFVHARRVYKSTTKNARLTGKITKKPTTVPWIDELHGKTVLTGSGVRFECLNFHKETHDHGKEKTQGAVDWVANIIYKNNGFHSWRSMIVPRTARIISVPMKNFKCGETCTEFKLSCYVAPEDAANSYYTYQMCGENRIQVVRYVENGVTYVAGYCVYIPRPYEWDAPYSETHIRNCYQGRKYFPKTNPVSTEVQTDVRVSGPKKLQVSSVNPQESEIESNPEFHTKNLRNFKLHFCKTKRDIVAIGCVNGVVKHFNWSIGTKSYKPVDCESCKLEEWEESPPPYHMLNVRTEEEA